jgi:hypothetical protein
MKNNKKRRYSIVFKHSSLERGFYLKALLSLTLSSIKSMAERGWFSNNKKLRYSIVY